MQVVSKTTHTYVACDGSSFMSEIACRTYEDALPRAVRFRTSHKLPCQAYPQSVETYQFGYRFETTRTVYPTAGFLQSGEPYETTDTHEIYLGFARGKYDDVVEYCVQQREFWTNWRTAFIRKIEPVNVNSH